MTNETVRERLNKYRKICGTPYRRISRDAGLTDKLYLVSRFARGLDLNEQTLKMVDRYLSGRGY